MVIPESVRKRLERLEVYLSHLEEMAKVKERDFLNDWKIQDVVLRNYQVAIETCVDIGAHLISQKGLTVPDTYVGVIEVLEQSDILPKGFSNEFKDLVKFRNIIVHEYLYLDYKKVYQNLKKVSELRGYIKYIVQYLSNLNATIAKKKLEAK